MDAALTVSPVPSILRVADAPTNPWLPAAEPKRLEADPRRLRSGELA